MLFTLFKQNILKNAYKKNITKNGYLFLKTIKKNFWSE